MMWQSFWYMLLLCALIAAGLLLFRKVMPRLTPLRGRDLQVLESAALGARNRVYLLRVGKRKLLVGGAKEGLVMLADVSEGEEFAGELLNHETSATAHMGREN